MKFLDLFSGIGGFRMGMQRNGYKPIGYIEKDKFARKSYEAIYNAEREWTAKDVQRIEPEEIPDFDILCAGFPCQDFSSAGKERGFEGTRGTLFYEIGRIAKVKKPEYLFLENVKNLLGHNGGKTFGTILKSLGKLGYDVEWELLDSKNFGVPQHRERVYIIGYFGGKPERTVFPIKRKGSSDKRGIQQGEIIRELGYTNGRQGFMQGKNVLSPDGICTTAQKSLVEKIMIGDNIRKLTSREYWRLQGFPDWAYEKARKVNSENELYKQAGNSVTVPVIETIAKKI